jgi:hypothetical protein
VICFGAKVAKKNDLTKKNGEIVGAKTHSNTLLRAKRPENGIPFPKKTFARAPKSPKTGMPRGPKMLYLCRQIIAID